VELLERDEPDMERELEERSFPPALLPDEDLPLPDC
jgi:hypothetical protein